MASIDITDKWIEDPRRLELVAKLGDIVTDGTAIKLWRLAFTYYKLRTPVIPAHLFDRIPNSALFIEHGLAERRDDGVYIRGSKDEFEWYDDGLSQRSEAGRISAQRPRDEKGRLLPRAPSDSNGSPTKSNEIQPPSLPPSPSQGNLGSKSSRPDGAGRGADPIYKSAKELRGGMASKLGEWMALYPDAKFLEDELLVVYQHYADKPERRPTNQAAWIKAVAYHLKHAWEMRKNTRGRDALLESVGGAR